MADRLKHIERSVEPAVSISCRDLGDIIDMSVDDQGRVVVALTVWKKGKVKDSLAAITSVEDLDEALALLKARRVVVL